MATVKSISIKRTYSFSSYENRVVEQNVELSEGDNADEVMREMTTKVERIVREDWFKNLEEEIEERRNQLRNLHSEVYETREERNKLKRQTLESQNLIKEFLLILFTKDELIELCGLKCKTGDYELAKIMEEE